MCPMLWCRASFEDVGSTLRHVARCPKLKEAEYWCPHCLRPERFLDHPKSGQTTTSSSMQRRDSKLKRAVTFFKHLRHRRNPTSRTHGSACAPAPSIYTVTDKSGYGSGPESLAEDGWPDDPVPAELSSHSSQARRPRYEMPAKDVGSSLQAATVVIAPEKITSLHPEREPPAYQRIAALETNNDPLKDVGSQFNNVNSRWYCLGREAQIVSPISLDDVHVPCRTTVTSSVESNSNFSLTRSLVLPELSEDTVNSQSASSGTVGRSPAHEDSLNPEHREHDRDSPLSLFQAEDLRDIVLSLHREWLQRLSNCPELRDVCSKLDIANVFHTGLQTLQACLHGMLPRGIQATYSLMVIAVACAYMVQWDNDHYSWNDLFEDMFWFQSAIIDDEQRVLFHEVIKQVLFTPMHLELPQGSHGSIHQMITRTQESKLTSSVVYDRIDPESAPRIGHVVNACLAFLDGKSEGPVAYENCN